MKYLWWFLSTSIAFSNVLCKAKKSKTGLCECLPCIVREVESSRITTVLPSRYAVLFGRNQTLSRHHIIPVNMLIEFATISTGFTSDTVFYSHAVRHFQQILHFYMNVNALDLFPEISVNHAVNLGSENERVIKLIVAIFQWIPGNIFYGPSPEIRADDAGQFFEHNALSLIPIERFILLNNLHNWLHFFINYPHVRTIENYEMILNMIESLANMNAHEFDENQWTHDGMFYRIRVRECERFINYNALQDRPDRTDITVGAIRFWLALYCITQMNIPKLEEISPIAAPPTSGATSCFASDLFDVVYSMSVNILFF